jgi:hypothetical protein
MSSYIDNKEYKRIEGWSEHGAFKVLEIINDFQQKNKISGSMCEIGVHYGQFFIAMALLAKDNELCLGIDCFEKQEFNVDKSGYGDINIFKRNLSSYNVLRKTKIISANSLEVKSKDILSKLECPTRIFHVDGGHTVLHILNDLSLVERCCAHAGVVIVDDFFHPQWPGVTEGISRYFSQIAYNPILFPFAYGNGKLYLSRFEWREKYMNLLGEPLAKSKRKAVDLWGTHTMWVNYE